MTKQQFADHIRSKYFTSKDISEGALYKYPLEEDTIPTLPYYEKRESGKIGTADFDIKEENGIVSLLLEGVWFKVESISDEGFTLKDYNEDVYSFIFTSI